MIKKIKLYLLFYWSKFIIPLAFAYFVLFANETFMLAFLTLALSSIFVWFFHHYLNDPKKKTLYMYFNLGISELKLYLFTFSLNVVFLIIGNLFV